MLLYLGSCGVPVQPEARPRPVATTPVCLRISQHASYPRASGTPVPMAGACGYDSASAQGAPNLEMVIKYGSKARGELNLPIWIQCRALALLGTENHPMTR